MKQLILTTLALLVCAIKLNAQEESKSDCLLPSVLDHISQAINKDNQNIYDHTNVKFFFDYYAVLVSNPYSGETQGANYTHEMLFGLTADLEKIDELERSYIRNIWRVQRGRQPIEQDWQLLHSVGIKRNRWRDFL